MGTKLLFRDKKFKGVRNLPSVVSTYRLNRQKNCLECSGEEDLQARIDSQVNSALDVILDRFLYDGADLPEQDPVSGWSSDVLQDRLDLAAAAIENLEEVRDTYHLPDDLTYDQIRDFMEKQYQNLKLEKEKKNEKKKPQNVPKDAQPQNQSETVPEKQSDAQA